MPPARRLRQPSASRPLTERCEMSNGDVAQRNVEMARKGYAAFNDQDVETVASLLNDDAVWHVGGDSMLTGEYKGKQKILEFFMQFGQVTEGSYRADIHDIVSNDEHTIVLGTQTATRKGANQSARFVDIIHPDEEGRVKEFWRFYEDQAVVDAFLRD